MWLGWELDEELQAWIAAGTHPDGGGAGAGLGAGVPLDSDGTGAGFAADLQPDGDGIGAGFAAGCAASRLAPGPVLAWLAQNAWADELPTMSDDALVGVLRAWRRLASWATAGELAAVTELDRRRRAEVAAGADPHLAEHVGDELAVSLTLTTRSADALLDFACGLARLPLTRAALAAGQIDRSKALVISDGVSCLSDAHAAAVESAVMGRAPGQTSGQLRAATQRAVLAVDPGAALRRREEARKDARVEVWDERSGTAALAGRDLPPADVLAADKRIDALARHLKSAGREETLSQLRAQVFTALLLGQPVEALSPAEPGSGTYRPGSPNDQDGFAAPPRHGDGLDSGSGTRGPASGRPECVGPGHEASGETAGRDRPPGTALADPGAPNAGTPDPGRPDRGTSGRGAPDPGTPDRGAPDPRTPDRGTSESDRGMPDRGAPDPAGRGALESAGAPRPGPGLTGSVNLTMPLATWLSGSAEPGDVAGFGPVPCDDVRALAELIARQPRARWCLTLTGRDGRAIGHGCARASPPRAGPDDQWRPAGNSCAGPMEKWALAVTIRPVAAGGCLHERESAGYQPSPALRHIVNVRQRTCGFPGCRSPATRCDQDHTVPYDLGGKTCECNLAALCRRHHRAKQAQGWRLDQPEPGVLVWRLPHGRSYRVAPDNYSGDSDHPEDGHPHPGRAWRPGPGWARD